jgi:imidazolonepropionase-like amidohydrolase
VPADLVVYDADPRADLDVLARPALTVLRGRVVRGRG